MATSHYALMASLGLLPLCLRAQQPVFQQMGTVSSRVLDSGPAPQYPGGLPQLMQDLQHSVRYPAAALRAQASGTVLVEVVVEADGSVGPPRILKSPSPLLSDEVLTAVKGLHGFSPALADGKPVRGVLTCPVTFRIMGGSMGTARPSMAIAGPPQPQALPAATNSVVEKLVSFRDSTTWLDKTVRKTSVTQHYFTYDRQGRPQTHVRDFLSNGVRVASQLLRYEYRKDGKLAAKVGDHFKTEFDYRPNGGLRRVTSAYLNNKQWVVNNEALITEKVTLSAGARVISFVMRQRSADSLRTFSTIDYTVSARNTITESVMYRLNYQPLAQPIRRTFVQDTRLNPFQNLFVDQWPQNDFERAGPHNVLGETYNGRPARTMAYTYNTAGHPTRCSWGNSKSTSRTQQFAYANIVVPAPARAAGQPADSINQVSIFPNPATAVTTIRAAGIGQGEATLRIFSAGGQLQRETKYAASETRFEAAISVAGLEKGVYVVEISGHEAVAKGRLVVE